MQININCMTAHKPSYTSQLSYDGILRPLQNAKMFKYSYEKWIPLRCFLNSTNDWETRTIQLDRGQQDRHWQGKEKGEAFYSFLLKERDEGCSTAGAEISWNIRTMKQKVNHEICWAIQPPRTSHYIISKSSYRMESRWPNDRPESQSLSFVIDSECKQEVWRICHDTLILS